MILLFKELNKNSNPKPNLKEERKKPAQTRTLMFKTLVKPATKGTRLSKLNWHAFNYMHFWTLERDFVKGKSPF